MSEPDREREPDAEHQVTPLELFFDLTFVFAMTQRNLSVTADRYTHVMMDYREIDRAKLLERVRTAPPSVHTSTQEGSAIAGAL